MIRQLFAIGLSLCLAWTSLPAYAGNAIYTADSPPGQNYITTPSAANGNLAPANTIAQNQLSIAQNFLTQSQSGISTSRSASVTTYQNVTAGTSRAATTSPTLVPALAAAAATSTSASTLSNPDNGTHQSFFDKYGLLIGIAGLAWVQSEESKQKSKAKDQFDKFTNHPKETYYLCADSPVKKGKGSRWASTATDAANGCRNRCDASQADAKGKAWSCNDRGTHDDARAQDMAANKLGQEYVDKAKKNGHKFIVTYDDDGNVASIEETDKDGKNVFKSWKVRMENGKEILDLTTLTQNGVAYQKLQAEDLAALKDKGMDPALIDILRDRMAKGETFMTEAGRDGISGNIFKMTDSDLKNWSLNRNDQIVFADKSVTVAGTPAKIQGTFVYRPELGKNEYLMYQDGNAFTVGATEKKNQKDFSVYLKPGEKIQVSDNGEYYRMDTYQDAAGNSHNILHQENHLPTGDVEDKVWNADKKQWVDSQSTPTVDGKNMKLEYDPDTKNYRRTDDLTHPSYRYDENGRLITGKKLNNGYEETWENGALREKRNIKTGEIQVVSESGDQTTVKSWQDPVTRKQIKATLVDGTTDKFALQDNSGRVISEDGSEWSGTFRTVANGHIIDTTYEGGVIRRQVETDANTHQVLQDITNNPDGTQKINSRYNSNMIDPKTKLPMVFTANGSGQLVGTWTKMKNGVPYSKTIMIDMNGKTINGEQPNGEVYVNGVHTQDYDPKTDQYYDVPTMASQIRDQKKREADAKAEAAKSRAAQPGGGGTAPGGGPTAGTNPGYEREWPAVNSTTKKQEVYRGQTIDPFDGNATHSIRNFDGSKINFTLSNNDITVIRNMVSKPSLSSIPNLKYQIVVGRQGDKWVDIYQDVNGGKVPVGHFQYNLNANNHLQNFQFFQDGNWVGGK